MTNQCLLARSCTVLSVNTVSLVKNTARPSLKHGQFSTVMHPCAVSLILLHIEQFCQFSHVGHEKYTFAENACGAHERIETRLEMLKSDRLHNACQAWVELKRCKTMQNRVFSK